MHVKLSSLYVLHMQSNVVQASQPLIMTAGYDGHHENLMLELSKAAAAASAEGSSMPPYARFSPSSVSPRIDFSILVSRAATRCLGIDVDSSAMISRSLHRGCYKTAGGES